jgi:hypothetical protein
MWPDTLKLLCKISWQYYKRPTEDICKQVKISWKEACLKTAKQKPDGK